MYLAINNVVFNDNVAWFYGGAILCNDSSPIMENTTISQNTSDGFGGGISCETNSHPIVLNSIFWNNEPHEVYFMNHSDANSFFNGLYAREDVWPLLCEPF